MKACIECKHKKDCTSNEKGRSVRRREYQEIYDEVNKRTLENKELYSQRQMMVEHPFGTIKRGLGFTYFLTRGNESVKSESFVHFLIYNLKRVINIIGTKGIMEQLTNFIFDFFKRILCFSESDSLEKQICLRELKYHR